MDKLYTQMFKRLWKGSHDIYQTETLQNIDIIPIFFCKKCWRLQHFQHKPDTRFTIEYYLDRDSVPLNAQLSFWINYFWKAF